MSRITGESSNNRIQSKLIKPQTTRGSPSYISEYHHRLEFRLKFINPVHPLTGKIQRTASRKRDGDGGDEFNIFFSRKSKAKKKKSYNH